MLLAVSMPIDEKRYHSDRRFVVSEVALKWSSDV